MVLCRYNIIVNSCLLTIFLAFVSVCHAGEYGKQKVVYHINYDDQVLQSRTLRNMQNHIAAVGEENIQIVAVLHDGGITMLNINSNEELLSKVNNLRLHNVKFKVSDRTLQSRNINYKTDLLDVYEQDIISSGIEELVRLKSDGFEYIKPY